MTREDRQEALSVAYIKAVTAVRGMTYSIRSKDYGIDVTLHEIQEHGARFEETGLRLDIQVKSTTSAVETWAGISYDLSVRAYDALIYKSAVPRILAVFVLPADESLWLARSDARLELRKCVYWLSLRGHPRVRNRSSVRVHIPRRQMFTPDALRRIMNRIRIGEIPS
jgi:hypothetical protein